MSLFFSIVDEATADLIAHWYHHPLVLRKGNLDKRIARWQDIIRSIEYARGIVTMAKKQRDVGATKTTAQHGFTPITWTNCNLTDDDIARIDAWAVSDSDIFTAISGMVGEGYTFTIKRSPDGESVMAVAIGQDPKCVNAGYGLSAFSDTPDSAIKVLLYKHFDVLSGLWGANTPPKSKYR